jgi:hypothetical protein
MPSPRTKVLVACGKRLSERPAAKAADAKNAAVVEERQLGR